MSLPSELRDRAFRWIADDPDPDTRMELQQVAARAMGGDQAAVDELADRMNGTPTFGTAGLRGPVRAGSNGMNRAVVLRATAGVAEWLRHKGHAGGMVIVGRDARHGSAAFSAAAAEVLTAAGFAVRTLPGPLPTPVTAFLVRSLGAVAGIQITASHNPPADNGYKVYTDDGAQIVPPDDRLIEAAIRGVPAARSVPTSAGALPVSESQVAQYLDRVTTLPHGTARALRVVLTPMHGVGGATALEALRRAGFADVSLVPEQAEPDPDFPTVSFPNPEEPGAADLLLRHAASFEADLAIALDPDADRCALGIRRPDGEWRMLSGDETGTLLGDHVLSTVERLDPLVASTIVSSSLLGRIAAARGARHVETLTGFKWLMRAGDSLVFAYEEALGLAVDPDFVRDKDGISAAVLACDLAATLKAAGRTVLDALDDLALAHGVHLTTQVSLRVADPSTMPRLVAGLRAEPPASLAGVAVSVDNVAGAPEILRLRADGLRVVVRPSGTEPKVKAYLEIVEPAEPSLAEARSQADSRMSQLREEVTNLLGV